MMVTGSVWHGKNHPLAADMKEGIMHSASTYLNACRGFYASSLLNPRGLHGETVSERTT